MSLCNVKIIVLVVSALPVIAGLLFVVCCLLFVVCCLLLFVVCCCLLFIVYCLLFIDCLICLFCWFVSIVLIGVPHQHIYSGLFSQSKSFFSLSPIPPNIGIALILVSIVDPCLEYSYPYDCDLENLCCTDGCDEDSQGEVFIYPLFLSFSFLFFPFLSFSFLFFPFLSFPIPFLSSFPILISPFFHFFSVYRTKALVWIFYFWCCSRRSRITNTWLSHTFIQNSRTMGLHTLSYNLNLTLSNPQTLSQNLPPLLPSLLPSSPPPSPPLPLSPPSSRPHQTMVLKSSKMPATKETKTPILLVMIHTHRPTIHMDLSEELV